MANSDSAFYLTEQEGTIIKSLHKNSVDTFLSSYRFEVIEETLYTKVGY